MALFWQNLLKTVFLRQNGFILGKAAQNSGFIQNNFVLANAAQNCVFQIGLFRKSSLRQWFCQKLL